MIDLIFAMQIVIALVALLWSYDRYAKRWVATRGNDVVIGSVNDVGYVAGEGGGSIIVSYGYSVDGVRYYGAFHPSAFEEIGLFNFKIRTPEIEAIFREKYPKGHEVRVYFFHGSPAEHWVNEPPSKSAVLWKATWLPLLILLLTWLPLGFVQLLITLSAK